MSKTTEINYAVLPLEDRWLLTQTCGSLALHTALIMDSITFENNTYKITKKHHNLDDDSYIFIVEKLK